MFGMIPKRRGIFEPPQPYERPGGGFGGGLEGPVSAQMPGMPQPEQQQRPKGGFFRQGGMGRHIAGSIGDALMQQAGMQPIYAPTMAYQQQRADALADEQRKRSLGMEDFIAKEQWKRDNPAPDAFERAMAGAGIDPASAEGQRIYRARTEAMARDPMDEFVVVPIPGRGTYAGPRSGLADVFNNQVPTAPVGKLTPIQETSGSNAAPGFRR